MHPTVNCGAVLPGLLHPTGHSRIYLDALLREWTRRVEIDDNGYSAKSKHKHF